jgi:hypothetical protein
VPDQPSAISRENLSPLDLRKRQNRDEEKARSFAENVILERQRREEDNRAWIGIRKRGE